MGRVIKCCCAARWGFNFSSRLFTLPALLYFPQNAQSGRFPHSFLPSPFVPLPEGEGMLWLPLPLGEGWGEGNTLLLPKKIRVPAPRCHSRSPAYSLQGQAFKRESMAMPFDYAGVNPVLREVNSLFARNTGLGAGWCRMPKLGVPTCGLGGIGCTGFPLKYCGNGGGGRMADGGWGMGEEEGSECQMFLLLL